MDNMQAANRKQEICFEKDRFEPEVNEAYDVIFMP